MIKALRTIKKQAIGIAFIIEAALQGIIAFIAAYFFKPLWEKSIQYWRNFTNDR